MKTKKYLKDLLDGRGHLNPNIKKTSSNSPDYQGYIKIDNKIYRASSWVHQKGHGKILSINVTEADDDGQILIQKLKPTSLD